MVQFTQRYENYASISSTASRVRELCRKLFYAADDFDYEEAKNVIGNIGEYELSSRLDVLYLKAKDAVENIDYDLTKRMAASMLSLL